jgi:hypothetical protein
MIPIAQQIQNKNASPSKAKIARNTSFFIHTYSYSMDGVGKADSPSSLKKGIE